MYDLQRLADLDNALLEATPLAERLGFDEETLDAVWELAPVSDATSFTRTTTIRLRLFWLMARFGSGDESVIDFLPAHKRRDVAWEFGWLATEPDVFSPWFHWADPEDFRIPLDEQRKGRRDNFCILADQIEKLADWFASLTHEYEQPRSALAAMARGEVIRKIPEELARQLPDTLLEFCRASLNCAAYAAAIAQLLSLPTSVEPIIADAFPEFMAKALLALQKINKKIAELRIEVVEEWPAFELEGYLIEHDKARQLGLQLSGAVSRTFGPISFSCITEDDEDRMVAPIAYHWRSVCTSIGFLDLEEHRCIAQGNRTIREATELANSLDLASLSGNRNDDSTGQMDSPARRRWVPKWDERLGTLFYHGRIVKKVRNIGTAIRVKKVLGAFQTQNWPISIQNPLAGDEQTLRDTVRSLNTNLTGITFELDGSGRIRWVTQPT
jgi:hypothetical protein